MAKAVEKVRAWALVTAYAGCIFLISSRPTTGYMMPFSGSDKVLHAIEYAGLCALICRALSRSRTPLSMCMIAAAMILAIAYGALDELHQVYVPSRTADWRDLIANGAGAVAAGVLWPIVAARFPWMVA